MTQRRLGLLGGTFNPPHLAHLILGEWARDELQLDAVWFMPNSSAPHRYAKAKPRAVTPEQRGDMVRAAVQGLDGFAACDEELRRDGPSYTIDTLRALRVRHPDTAWHFIVGMDAARELPTWEGFADLCGLCAFIVARRPGEPESAPEIPPARTMLLTMPQIGISSTMIRERVAAGRSIRHLVPRAVEDYITAHDLYRNGRA